MGDKKQECRGCIGFDEAHTCDEWAQFQIMKKEKDKCRTCEAKDKCIADIQAVVSEQAENEDLWFVAKYATEAYLQSELRRLHEIIEGKSRQECARETLAAAKEKVNDRP